MFHSRVPRSSFSMLTCNNESQRRLNFSSLKILSQSQRYIKLFLLTLFMNFVYHIYIYSSALPRIMKYWLPFAACQLYAMKYIEEVELSNEFDVFTTVILRIHLNVKADYFLIYSLSWFAQSEASLRLCNALWLTYLKICFCAGFIQCCFCSKMRECCKHQHMSM